MVGSSLVRKLKYLGTAATLIFALTSPLTLQASPAQALAWSSCTSGIANVAASDIANLSSGGSCLIQFKSTANTWTVPSGVTSAAVAIVGGGGGGGFGSNAGAGGAGEVLVNTSYTVVPGNVLTVGIGAGGTTGYSASSGSWTSGGRGGTTQFGSNYAGGGGGGWAYSPDPVAPSSATLATNYGGSSGGGSVAHTTTTTGVVQSLSAPWLDYAHSGGTALAGTYSAGGGGGAGAAGSNATSSSGGAGGAGLTLPTVFGSAAVAGGGGGWMGGGTGGAGGLGGGGRGATQFTASAATPADGSAGTDNTGSGGGSGWAGGSGTVYLQYYMPTITFNANGGTGTMAAVNVQIGTALPANTFIRNGYVFKGWATSATGQVALADQALSTTTSNVTYYAVWAGTTDYAASLNPSGASDYFSNSSAQVIPATGSFTAEAWINPTSTAGNSVIVSEGTSPNRFFIDINSSGQIVALRDNGSATATAVTTTTVPYNAWTHVAVVMDGSYMYFYFNGQLVQTTSYSFGSTSVGTGFYVGQNSWNQATDTTTPFRGQIDQVKVWGSALTSAQLGRSMNAFGDTDGTGQIASTLRDAFGFNENVGTVNDFKNSVTLSASGSATFAAVATVDSTRNVYKFPRTYLTTVGGWIAPSAASFDYLEVAGGGSGGDRSGGGGGAGGLVTSMGTPANRVSVSAGAVVNVTVGAGGVGFNNMHHGVNGTNSSISPVSGASFTITAAVGGGAGGAGGVGCTTTGQSGTTGGSGGGALGFTTVGSCTSGTPAAGSGTAGQGNAGALGSDNNGGLAQYWTGGGGGGAGAVATAGNINGTGGAGGAGLANGITGTNVCYAGGGGGGAYGGGAGYSGGAAGTCAGLSASGGAGSSGNTVASNAVANTGGGGGGSGFYDPSGNGTPGWGGTGVVILRALASSAPAPTFDTPVITGGGTGFTVNITNFDGFYTYNKSITSGSVSVSLTGAVTVTGLTAGAAYTLTLTATDGTNSASSTLTPPATPTSLVVKPGDGQLQLSLSQTSSTNSPVSGLQYSTNSGSTWTSVSQTTGPITLTGLTNGTTYNYLVRAVGAGYSSSSTTVSGAPGLVLDMYASNYNATTGVWADSSANGNNLTYTGTKPTLGSYPSAVNFTGGTLFALGTQYATSTSVGTYSVGAWFSTTSTGKIIGFGVSHGYDRHLYVGTDGYLYAGLCASTCTAIPSNSRVNDGVWRYAVSTFDGSTLRLYINGVLQSTTFTKDGTPSSYTNSWNIGGTTIATWPHAPTGDAYFTGGIGHVFAYHRALTSPEISSMYTNEAVPYTPLTISFANGGGSGSQTSSSAFPNGPYTLPSSTTFVRAGYVLSGWSDGQNTYSAGAPYTMPASGSVTLTAQWASNALTATYNDSNGGTTTGSYSQNGSLTLPSPTRTGYVLKGWSTDSGGSNMVGAGGATYYPTQNTNQQLNYSFNDSASYPGSGATVSDISPNSGGVSASISGTPSFVSGPINYLNISSTSNLLTNQLYSRVGEGSVSVFGWVYPTADGVILDELGNSDYAWHDSQIEVYGGKLYMRMYNGSYITSTVSVLNAWHYVGFTFNGSTLVGYLDGTKFATSSSYTRSSNPNNSIFYGFGQSDGTAMKTSAAGTFRLGGMQIWNTGLSETAVSTNFQAGCTTYSVTGCAGLTLYAQWLPAAAAPTVSSPAAATKSVGQSVTFTSSATRTDGGQLSYQWYKDSGAISGAIGPSYTINSVASGDAGSYTVTVTNTLYNGQPYVSNTSATSSAATLTVVTAPAITTPTTGLSATYNSAYSLTVAGTVGTSGKTFSVSGTLPPGLTLNSATGVISGTPTTGGSYPLTVTITDDNTATATTNSFTIVVGKIAQTITFGALGNKTMGTGTFTVSATASSGNTVTFSPADVSKCTVSGTTVTLVAAGTCTINANQAGDSNYNAATQVSQSFTISAAMAITTPTTGLSGTVATAYSLSITNSGGAGSNTWALASGTLPAGLTLNPSTGVIAGTPTSAGSQTISVKYTDANTATITTSLFTIAIAAANQTITFAAPAAQNLNAGAITVAPTTSASGLSVTVTSNSLPVCTVNGFTVAILTSGTCSLTATQTGNANYNAATAVTQTVTINPSVVTFNSNYGTATTSTQTITTVGSVTLSANTFSRSGYTFSGWNTVAAGGGAAYTDGQSVTLNANVTLYAQWTANTLNVTWNSQGGSAVTASTTTTGASISAAPTAPTKSGYSFAGWFTATTGGTALVFPYAHGQTADFTLYAQWAANTLNVTWNSQGGSAVTGSTTTTGASISAAPSAPTKSGYSFAGWFTATTGGTALVFPYAHGQTADFSLYAHWSAVNYTISYSSNSATSGSAPTDSNNYNIGGSIVVLGNTGNLTRTGYTFGGWNTAADASGTQYVAADTITVGIANVTLYAKWIPVNYTVTYSATTADGGSVPVDSANYNITQSITIRGNTGTLTRSGYTFAGWTDNSAGTGTVYISGGTYTVGSASLTFYAKWTAISYSVTYHASTAGSGSVPVDGVGYNIGGTVTVIGNSGTLARTGYTFAGWTTASDGSGTTYLSSDTISVAAANIDLYAKWTPINYSVTYNANTATSGSAPTDSTNYNIGQNITARGNTGNLVRTGYSFAGWNTAADGSGTTYQSGNQVLVASSNITLYAKWNANTYAITYNANGAGGSLARTNDSYTTGTTGVTLPGVGTLAKSGYNFGGWSTTAAGSAISGTYTTITDVTLYAVWTIKSIPVHYLKGYASSANFTIFPSDTNANYGTSINIGSGVDNRVTIGGTQYDLVGWSDGNSIYQTGNSYLVGDATINFTAVWVPVYAVRYVFNGGTPAGSDSSLDSECHGTDSTCTDQQVITVNAAPTRAGYTFNGWVDQSSQTVAAGTTTTISATSYLFYASWSAINYTVVYDSDGGSTAPTQANRTIGQSFSIGNAVTKTGYSFSGWSDGSQLLGPGATYVVGTSNVTLTAQWVPNVYNVTYDWNGGYGSAVSDVSYTVGTSAFALPLVTDHAKDGYNFNGWSTSPNGNLLGATFTPTGSTTLYAIWGSGSYSISMNPNGGSVSTTSYSVANGSGQVMPTPTRTHFHFDGWYDAASGGTLLAAGGATFTPSSSKTLYAHWTQDSLLGMGTNTKIGSITISNAVVPQFSASSSNSSVSVTVPINSLPTNSVVDVYLLTDTSHAASLITGNNNFLVNLVVSWLAADGTVPTASGSPISVTITNSSIKTGAAVYTLIGNTATYVGTATQDGQVTVTITDDPELVVAAVVPGTPIAASAVAGNQSAVVSWSAPTTDGGASITSYVVTSSGGQTCTTTGSLSCTVNGLTNGTAYTFTVQAVNSVGNSVSSAATNAVTPLAPQSITFGSLANRTMGTGTVTLSATATSSLGVTFTSADTSKCTISSTTLTLVAAGTCTVYANQAGGSGFAAASQVSQSFTVSPALTIVTPSGSALAATYNSPYTMTLSSSGGAGGNSFALASGSLPSGLSLIYSTGVISGTPNASGGSAVTIAVTDANGATASATFTITVSVAGQSALTLDTLSGTFGTPLNLTASGGSSTGLISFAIANGTTTCTLNGSSLSASGAGTCIVTATRAADANYSAASTSPTTVTFAPAAQAGLSVSTLSGTYGTTLGLNTSGGSGQGAVTYVLAAGTTSCTLNGSNLTAAGAGTCLVTATKASDSNYNSVTSAQATVTFTSANQASLSVSTLSGTYGTTLGLNTSGGSGQGAVTYVVAAGTTSCSLNGSNLTAAGAGTCLVTATKAADSNYNSVTSAQATVTFAQSAQAAITVTSTAGTYLSALPLVAVGGSSTGSITFTVSNGTTTCNFDGTSVATTGAGTCTVTATRAGDTNYVAVSSSATTVTFGKAAQTISFLAPSNRTVGQAAVTVFASATSSGPVTFTSGSPSVCTVAGTAVTLVSAGSCVINADQSGTADYLAASQVSRSFTVSQTLVINTPSSGLAGFNTVAFSLGLTGSGGSGGNTYAVTTGSLPAGLTINTSTGQISGTPVSAGNSIIAVTVTDSNGASATTGSFTIAISQLSQATFTLVTLSGSYGTPLALNAVGGSGSGSVSYSVSAGTTSCSLNGTTITPAGAGTCLVTATKAADGTYNAVSTAATTVTFAQAAQAALTITAGSGTALTPATLVATGGSGTGSISFAVTNGTGTCAINGSTITAATAGTCSITATKAADSNYTQVTSSAVTYTFALAAQNTPLVVSSITGIASQALMLTVTGGNGNGTVTFSVTDGTTTCTLANGAVIAAAVGTCTITATKAADATYLQAVSAAVTVTFSAAPILQPGPSEPVAVQTPATAPTPDAWSVPTVAVTPGQAAVVLADKVSPANATATSDGLGIRVATPEWDFTLKVGASSESAVIQSAAGVQLVVQAGTTVTVAGDKFQPGTTVKVWLYSSPLLLGTVQVKSDGTFADALSVPVALELGNHTLVLQGINSKNEVQNAQASLLLKASPATSQTVNVSGAVRFPLGSARVSTTTHKDLSAFTKSLQGLSAVTITTVTYYLHPSSLPRALKVSKLRAAVIAKQLRRAGITAVVKATTKQTSQRQLVGQLLELEIVASKKS